MPETETSDGRRIILRKPNAKDGVAIWELIRACKPLDENSIYCNLVQADHFRDTCVLAECDGEIMGWMSGHLLPAEPETLFIWQAAVSEKARGAGLARRMLAELIDRTGARQIKTTITKDNDASWALFTRFAKARDAALESEAYFERDAHFGGRHATEYLVTITFAKAVPHAA